ncbi:hypothetical protein CL658_01020 [bacterium]|nr:hypothetical protein [bacterium]|tara:strand:- start:393 stop:767 length:375 start_codon:yes stop_codon:yes gene_type:complete
MSHVNELKQALENLSSKQHVISKEATLAKESLQENYNQKNNSELVEKQTAIMDEFSTSITLLMDIFSQSRFDSIMGLIADPLRLLLLNFFMSCFKGIGFAFGVALVILLIASVFGTDLISFYLN